jgi:hypothetical protein
VRKVSSSKQLEEDGKSLLASALGLGAAVVAGPGSFGHGGQRRRETGDVEATVAAITEEHRRRLCSRTADLAGRVSRGGSSSVAVVGIVVLLDEKGNIFLLAELRSPLPAVPGVVLAFPLYQVLESLPAVVPPAAEDLVDDEVLLLIQGDWWRRARLDALWEGSRLVVRRQKMNVEDGVDLHRGRQVEFDGDRGDDLADSEGSTAAGLQFPAGDRHFEVEVGGGEQNSITNSESVVSPSLVGIGSLTLLCCSKTGLGELQVGTHGSHKVVN